MTRSAPLPSLVLSACLLGLVLGAAVVPDDAWGQELPWPNGGQVRLDFAPSFWTWDSRYGEGPSGSEEVELLGMDLASETLGSGVLPDLVELENSLGQALGDPSYRVNLGVSRAFIDQSRLVFPFRLDVGITDWLSVGSMVPFVRPRTEITFALNADSLTANEGPSPFVTNPTEVIDFLDGLRAVLLDAEANHPGAPAVSAAQDYLEALTDAYSHASFFPVEGSSTGVLLQERFDELRTELADLGVMGLPDLVPMAQNYMDEEGFREFLRSRRMRAFPLEDWTELWSLGDVEIHANVRLLRGGFEPDSTGAMPRFRYQVGGGLLVRLGTGEQEDPARFFDQGTGDGQMDFEGTLFGMLEVADRVGAWGQVRYGIQNEGEIFRRIASPSAALPDFSRTAPLKWTPGNYLELDLNPHVFLTSAMRFGARYRFWSKGEDSYELGDVNPEFQDPAELPPADLLNAETEQRLQELGFSVGYSTVEAHAQGKASMPVHIRATYFHPIGGSGGQTPKGGRFEAGLTIFKTFWGGGDATAEAPEEPIGG